MQRGMDVLPNGIFFLGTGVLTELDRNASEAAAAREMPVLGKKLVGAIVIRGG